MNGTSKGYRRVELPTEPAPPPVVRPARKKSPARQARAGLLRIALATLGAALLVASGAQLLELMAAASAAEPTRSALQGLPTTEMQWTTVAGAVLMPMAAVLCFVAFGAVRTRVLRT
jgi:hypothetical protein